MCSNNTSSNKIKIGTSGYSYDDWYNHFYPADLSKSNMLSFYCEQFNTVELNVTYYRIPDQNTFARMADKTPSDFEFVVKVNQETTHRRKENESSLNQLLEAIIPIKDQQKFYGFLAQFPYSFKNNEQNRRYLIDTKQYLKDEPLFVEFRHDSWNKPPVESLLRENNIGYVNVDEPKLSGLLPKQDWITSENAYIRFHGRNEKDWWEGKGSARYDYEYNEGELKEWLVNISNVLKKTYKTYIFFNNHPNGQAARNAQQMVQIISQQLQINLD